MYLTLIESAEQLIFFKRRTYLNRIVDSINQKIIYNSKNLNRKRNDTHLNTNPKRTYEPVDDNLK